MSQMQNDSEYQILIKHNTLYYSNLKGPKTNPCPMRHITK